MNWSARVLAATAALVALSAWIVRAQRRQYYVSPRFLTWLRRQEEADRAEMERALERQPIPFRPRVEPDQAGHPAACAA